MKILSIDGGGIRGIYASHILARIEQELGIKLHEQFDLVAGTSTGSIIAAAISFGESADRVTRIYREKGSAIFTKRRFSFGGMAASKYTHSPLRDALEGVFGSKTLSETLTRLVIPATDIGNGTVHVFKSSYDPEFVRDRHVSVVDAVQASCSAPTFFSPTQVGPYMLADGGLWANNPALVAMTEALSRLKADRSKIQLLSIGTGTGRNFYAVGPSPKAWGFLFGWRPKKFIEMLMNLQSLTASNAIRLILPKEQHLRINFESDQALPLDEVSTIDSLVSRADQDFSRNIVEIRRFFGVGS